ncbi:uncharacterized protein PHALS_09030 [Plasmopara halstedii]|uniref:Uncharacterized protein n=1 Tax=Plasmopara halstedii TaxID=4781 RepID=A0A0P1A570_PLAHL|nr:uncharacterized protein PHALS_09030 [Plasmopara halstedii]CEG35218.1 hypothetical protein PHALS_09030 [Plasmopara halstedii]|eukprot:XP_024571587.1 hypothetical protein PHALS_09030 [Plasmopara halstedii]
MNNTARLDGPVALRSAMSKSLWRYVTLSLPRDDLDQIWEPATYIFGALRAYGVPHAAQI